MWSFEEVLALEARTKITLKYFRFSVYRYFQWDNIQITDIYKLSITHPSGKHVTLAIESRVRVCDINVSEASQSR
jgi:hypothetical protein